MISKKILVCLLTLVLITTIFAAQIGAGKNKPTSTCTDSDGGKDYYTRGSTVSCTEIEPVCDEHGCTGGGGCGAAVDKCLDPNTVLEHYCAGTKLRSTKHKCPNGCQNGACITKQCVGHELSVNKVYDENDKIAVEYSTVGAGSNVNVQLIVVSIPPEPEEPEPAEPEPEVPIEEKEPIPEEPEPEVIIEEEPAPEEPTPGSGGGGAGAISCPIMGVECSEVSGNEVAYCTVQTECNYPMYKPNTRYYVKVIDNECPAVYGKAEIIGTPSAICTDSDGGKNIFEKGTTSGLDWSEDVIVTETDFCITEGPKAGRLAEYYCYFDEGVYRVRSETFGPEDGCSVCQDGACIMDCSSHDVSVTDIFDKDGNIAVSYNILWEDDVKVDLITPGYPSNFSNTVDITPCPITMGECGVGYGSNLISCTVYTQCKYPLFDLGQSIRVTDENCIGVYDEMDVFSPAPTCTDTDGGIDYYTKGTVNSPWYVNPKDDSCSNDWVIEQFCENDVSEFPEAYHCDNGACYTKLQCPNGCSDGACVDEQQFQQLIFGVYDQAPDSDVILAFDFVETLAAEGYGTAPILLFSEITINQMDYTEFTVLVYLGGVVVVEGSAVPKEEALYQYIVNYLNNNGINYNITESEMITSPNLLDLFQTYHPADLNQDLRIEINELTAYGNGPHTESAVDIWTNGEYYSWHSGIENWIPFHPADTNQDLRIVIGELTAYGSGSESESAENIWNNGETYYWDFVNDEWLPDTI